MLLSVTLGKSHMRALVLLLLQIFCKSEVTCKYTVKENMDLNTGFLKSKEAGTY
jgi:hypothetical protein